MLGSDAARRSFVHVAGGDERDAALRGERGVDARVLSSERPDSDDGGAEHW
jgi:hypothetical protein